ncbi:NUDIX hydrolase [Pseudoflavitalea rhizosphaerae]|uniref:NUDIX hydrolase n=1 Tax=Pseudoflavitalea rhizosphaerae TaxID=1884793 RepID=UPI000F8D4F41|nr:NUDIX hydrolase [Pseudoflavitalea rhizosphaerae]
MIRNNLLELLMAYRTDDQLENEMLQDTINFIRQHPDCFERGLLIGHVTGSAWILNKEGTHTLMLHHKKLDKWFQPGGHCDGDPNVMAVAAKEAFEETGIDVHPLSAAVFDVDHHVIPERNGVPEHIHYDIRFLFQADKTADELPSNPEANAVRWIPLEKVEEYNDTPSILRLVKKTLK